MLHSVLFGSLALIALGHLGDASDYLLPPVLLQQRHEYGGRQVIGGRKVAQPRIGGDVSGDDVSKQREHDERPEDAADGQESEAKGVACHLVEGGEHAAAGPRGEQAGALAEQVDVCRDRGSNMALPSTRLRIEWGVVERVADAQTRKQEEISAMPKKNHE